eukprot:gnl/TRDRNA2_/TRDRNA2_136236_c1_seq2.p1 gnl/TRDRNA2_/TRDRNA2_136236_c1~~gnl/TRDRNA2_/TRDRNA2_136236_c1_seq2.p1  ORF type:complete len:146 (+),score=8.42 gnl/TRDRNA2_/TRDRNA2_136236_c1_seq2:145-582(+)
MPGLGSFNVRGSACSWIVVDSSRKLPYSAIQISWLPCLPPTGALPHEAGLAESLPLKFVHGIGPSCSGNAALTLRMSHFARLPAGSLLDCKSPLCVSKPAATPCISHSAMADLMALMSWLAAIVCNRNALNAKLTLQIDVYTTCF